MNDCPLCAEVRLLACLLLVPVLGLFAPNPARAQGYGVHFESFRTPEAAEQAWNLLTAAHPDLLAHAGHGVQRADLGPERGVFFRILAGPYADRAAAQELADRFTARGVYAMVLDFGDARAEPAPGGAAAPPRADAAPVDRPCDHEASPPPEPPAPQRTAAAKPRRLPGPKRRPSAEELAMANQGPEPEQQAGAVVTEDGRTWVPAPLPDAPDDPGFTSPVRVYLAPDGMTVRARMNDSVTTSVDVKPSAATLAGEPSGALAAGLTWDLDQFSIRPKVECNSRGDVSPYLGLGVAF